MLTENQSRMLPELKISPRNLILNILEIQESLEYELEGSNKDIKNVSFLQFDITRNAISNLIKHIEYVELIERKKVK